MNVSVAPSLTGAVTIASYAERLDTLIVGGGPTGYKLWRDLQRAGQTVGMLNAEREEPYNRVLLASLLSDQAQIGRVLQPFDPEGDGRTRHYSAVRAVAIHPRDRMVETDRGRLFAYRTLALCTGSVAFVPNVPGADAGNVFTFRNAEDAAALKARSLSARRVAVIGGGLLGLEVARSLADLGAETTVIEHEQRLMPRQLDVTAAGLLADALSGLGLRLRTGTRVAEILTEGGLARAVAFADGATLPVDTVIFCTGVRPEVSLARAAGLAIGRGIVTGPDMRTSDPHILAAGECAEVDGRIEGLVGPCLEQAAVAAETILGRKARFRPPATSAKLKVVGVDIFSIGAVESLEECPGVLRLDWSEGASYRRLFIDHGRLVGAISVGKWAQANRVQEAVTARRWVGPIARARFARTGSPWPEEPATSAAAWPDATTVCNCTGVTRGRIGTAIAGGARTLDDLKLETGCSTVCGSCAPLVEEILDGGPAKPKPVRMWKPLVGLSTAAAALAVVTGVAPRMPLPDAFEAAEGLRTLWFDGIVKQWTGYILLGLTLAAMAIGLRKRLFRSARLGGYDWWRIVHLGIGGTTALALFAHTGFRFGANMTMALMVVFVLTLIAGAVAGLATGGEHRLREAGIGSAQKPPRRLPVWAHILLLWPLPVLIAAHVVAVYTW